MITDIILDSDIVVDICTKRQPFYRESTAAYDMASASGARIWLYSGCLQTLFYAVINEIRDEDSDQDKKEEAKELLRSFCQNINWLAALAEDGDVFSEGNPITNQLSKAVDRLGKNARVLTRSEEFLKNNSKTILVSAFLEENRLGDESTIPFIDLAAQQDYLRNQLEHNLHIVLNHGQYILGPEIRELEEKLCECTKAKYAITCSSGTDALLMPLMAKNIGRGDAVFTSPFTFIATAEVIALLGATPVFVDIDSRTFNLDPEKLREAVMRVKAEGNLHARCVIPVDLFGLPADYDEIMSIAEEENLFVLEDAAQGFGGVYKGRSAGSLADVAATSFFPAKPLGGYGDGGAVFTDDDELADKLKSIRVHGKGHHKYENIRVGLNARLDTVQAAVLLPKLKVFSEELEKRQNVADRYTEAIQGLLPTLESPLVPAGFQSAWAQYSVLTDRRDFIREELGKAGIPTVIYYPTPLHLQPAFADLRYRKGDFPVSESASQRIFSLPMSPYLSDQHIERIIQALEGLA